MLKTLVLICFLSFVGGCATHFQSSDPISFPLPTIYSAVESCLSMGIQGYSENRREITSRPFIVSQNPKAHKAGYHERGRATVTILGEARPYTIETRVAIERSEDPGDPNESEYKTIRYDEGLANKLLRNILQTLDKNNRDKNVIDDFRSF
jgi:hypothetical protein